MIDSVRDHPTIVEVLAAFVREHTAGIAANAEYAGLMRSMPFAATEEDAERAEALPATPRTDVQAAAVTKDMTGSPKYQKLRRRRLARD